VPMSSVSLSLALTCIHGAFKKESVDLLLQSAKPHSRLRHRTLGKTVEEEIGCVGKLDHGPTVIDNTLGLEKLA